MKKLPEWTELEMEPQVARRVIRVNVLYNTNCLFEYATAGLWDIYGADAIRRSKLDLCLSIVLITLSLLLKRFG